MINKNHQKFNEGEMNKDPFNNIKFRVCVRSYIKCLKKNIPEEVSPWLIIMTVILLILK